ncbi:hypothetical protein HDU76_013468 [Blyttiomyces sp. JEL0837]|nr:hypothetical protein HDU76_013468 [Blyttiomyces sp. JEL0837]
MANRNQNKDLFDFFDPIASSASSSPMSAPTQTTPSPALSMPQSTGMADPELPLVPEELTAYAMIFKIADTEGKGAISAAAAVPFLTKSRLPQNVLGEIWTMANPEGKSFLDQKTFYKILKLIALCQGGKPVSLQFLASKTALPAFEGVSLTAPAQTPPPIAKMTPQMTGNSSSSGTTPSTIPVQLTGSGASFQISNEERDRFYAAWNACNPEGGFVTGDAAKEIFLKSGLAVETLGRIWVLVDPKGALKLNLNQFMVAMFVISRMKSGALKTVPSAIPPALYNAISASTATLNLPSVSPQSSGFPSSTGSAPTPSASVPPLPPASRNAAPAPPLIPGPPGSGSPGIDRRRTTIMGRSPSSGVPPSMAMFGSASASIPQQQVAPVVAAAPSPVVDWVVKAEEKALCDKHFDNLDTGKKGYLSGGDSYEFFMKSKLDQNTLAQIW